MLWDRIEKLKFQLLKLSALAFLTILITRGIVSCTEPSAQISTKPIPISPSASPNAKPQLVPSSPPTGVGIVDEIARGLKQGRIVFNTPTNMQIGEAKTISLLLSPTKSIQQLQSELNSQDKVEAAKINISNHMKAELTGKGFKIEPLPPEEQAVSSGTTTQWQWEITPIEEGTQELYLHLSSVITVSNQNIELVVERYHRAIQVQVSAQYRLKTFLKESWQWLWAAILVPVASFLLTRLPRKSMKKEL